MNYGKKNFVTFIILGIYLAELLPAPPVMTALGFIVQNVEIQGVYAVNKESQKSLALHFTEKREVSNAISPAR